MRGQLLRGMCGKKKKSNYCLGPTGYFNVPVILISNVEIKTVDVVVLECVGSAVLTWVLIT